MNATSLYVSTCRLVLGFSNNEDEDKDKDADKGADILDTRDHDNDLYRLVPYLRQSITCAVCDHLLREPYTPATTITITQGQEESSSASAAQSHNIEQCQHHVCSSCRGTRTRLWCSCSRRNMHYVPNKQIRILLQCYKKLCEYLLTTETYRQLVRQVEEDKDGPSPAGLLEHIREGAEFDDDYESPPGLSRSAYSILPCVYTNSSTQTQGQNQGQSTSGSGSSGSGSSSAETRSGSRDSPPIKTLSNGSSLYSVLYSGSGKITIKRKAVDEAGAKDQAGEASVSDIINERPNFKKPSYRSRTSASKRKGCRCGNATATPGKLTCCGQRCPCYVDSKACSECKCKGCRNPHRPNGVKVRPHIPLLDDLPILLPVKQELMDPDELTETTVEMTPIKLEEPDIKTENVYTSQLEEVSASLPATIMMDEEVSPHSARSDCDSLSPGFDMDIHSRTLQYSREDNTSDVEVEV